MANLGPHHRRAINWHWLSRHRVCRSTRWENEQRSTIQNGNLEPAEFEEFIKDYLESHKPAYYAYFPIWSRGHMKSTVARRVAVVDALISMYYELPGYCLYFSGTDKKIENHARSIEAILRKVAKHAPALARVKRTEEGSRSLGWKAEFLNTAAGYVYHFGSLQSGLAGANLEDVRPTLMIPDDIDDRKDSAVISEKNFNLLTTEILPMGSKGTLTFWAQNLISRFSSMYRIHKGLARVLTNRMSAKPIPAILDLVTEVQTVKGIPRDVIVSGTATWPYFSLDDCQDEINRIGLPAFLRECQHEVEQSREGLMIKTYDDQVHPISESEFASVYGSLAVWRTWNKWIFHDWARTKTKYHANVAGFFAISSQGGPLPGFRFIFNAMSFPEDSGAEDVAERILSCLSPIARAGDASKGELPMTWQQVRKDTLLRANATKHTATIKDELEYRHKAIADIVPKYSKAVLERFNVRGGVMSHSEDKLRKLYKRCYGITLSPSNPSKFDCVDEIDMDFKVDYNEQHPFRPGQKGYSTTFVICPDDRDAEPVDVITRVNGQDRKVKVYPPKAAPDVLDPVDLHDTALFRYQMLNWRIRPPELGKGGERVDEVLKLNDDFGQALQMLYFKKLFANVPLSTEAIVNAHMPTNLSEEAYENAPEAQKDNVLQARLKKFREVEQQVKRSSNPVSPGIGRIRRR